MCLETALCFAFGQMPSWYSAVDEFASRGGVIDPEVSDVW